MLGIAAGFSPKEWGSSGARHRCHPALQAAAFFETLVETSASFWGENLGLRPVQFTRNRVVGLDGRSIVRVSGPCLLSLFLCLYLCLSLSLWSSNPLARCYRVATVFIYNEKTGGNENIQINRLSRVYAARHPICIVWDFVFVAAC